MKNNKIFFVSIILNIILIIILYSILNENIKLFKHTKTIKDMSETTQVIDLNNTINNLNISNTEYMNYINKSKLNIANVITNEGVDTDADASFETIINNISTIFSVKTADATAIANEILNGKTVYVKGSKIVGTMQNNGELEWNPDSSTTYTLQEGYYSGGTLDSSGAYTAGYNEGKKDAKTTSSLKSIKITNTTEVTVYGWTAYGGWQNCNVAAGGINLTLSPTGGSGWTVSLTWN